MICRLSLTQYYSSIRVIKPRRMRWIWHVGCMGKEVRTRFWWGNKREGNHLEDLGVDGKKILKWFFQKHDGGREIH